MLGVSNVTILLKRSGTSKILNLLYLTHFALLIKSILTMTKFSTTLSAKNQITLPVALVQALNWKKGKKVSLIVKNNSIIIQSYEDILEDIENIIAGYKLPKVSVEEAIEQTHNTRNSDKYQYEN